MKGKAQKCPRCGKVRRMTILTSMCDICLKAEYEAEKAKDKKEGGQ